MEEQQKKTTGICEPIKTLCGGAFIKPFHYDYKREAGKVIVADIMGNWTEYSEEEFASKFQSIQEVRI
jgi:hypothetical protein